jgi:hypothetical protein
LDSPKPNYTLIIPENRITYMNCHAAVPYTLHLELELGEIFGKQTSERDDLPLRLMLHPAAGQSLQSRPSPVKLNGGLTVAWLDRHLSAVAKSKNILDFVALEGSFRAGLQRGLLEWLVGECEVRFSLDRDPTERGFVSAMDHWSIQLSCCGEMIASWESKDRMTFQIPYIRPNS